MIRLPVESSLIKSIGHNELTGEMHIEFNNGKVFSYTGPKVAEHFQGLMDAESIGKHFNANVRKCPDTKCEPVG